MPPSPHPDIRSQTREALQAQFESWEVPRYRLEQLLGWLYPRRAASWDEMTNLPRPLREQLSATYALRLPEVVRAQGARDTTRKFLWRLHDGSLVESVLIPANPAIYGEGSDRHTLCISTQVGCAYGCRFCASGLDGWKRNLQPEEIVGQILAVERWNAALPPGERIEAGRVVNNIVVMGMGEPMANYANVMAALRTLNAPWGGNIGARKITLSTSGVVPRIRDLANDPLQFRLAISLHGATDEVRNRIMPVNRKHPVADLAAACEYYVARKGKMITLEYILISGINDDFAQTGPLSEMARRLHAKVNLIPYNAVEGLEWRRPDDQACQAFVNALQARGVTATLRLEKGHDIDAACGQLRLKTERELGAAAGTRPDAGGPPPAPSRPSATVAVNTDAD